MSEFGSLNLEEIASEDTRLSTESQGNFLDQFVPMPEVKQGQTGSVTVRILPPVKGGKLYQYNRVHTVNGRKIHCPKPLKAGRWDRNVYCPICAYYSSLYKKSDKLKEDGFSEDSPEVKALIAEARSIKPAERYYYNAIVRKLTIDGEMRENVGPRIFSVGKKVHKMIMRAFIGDSAEAALGDVTNIKTGHDFQIIKEMNGEYPEYPRSKFSADPSPLGTTEEIKQWVENLHDLTKLRNVKEDDYLEKELAIHRGLIADDSEGFNVDNFDAKFKTEESTSVSVTVPEGVSESGVVVENEESVPNDGALSVEAAKYLDELEGFKEN